LERYVEKEEKQRIGHCYSLLDNSLPSRRVDREVERWASGRKVVFRAKNGGLQLVPLLVYGDGMIPSTQK